MTIEDQIKGAAHEVGMTHISYIVSDVIPELAKRFLERYPDLIMKERVRQQLVKDGFGEGSQPILTQEMITEIMHELTRTVYIENGP